MDITSLSFIYLTAAAVIAFHLFKPLGLGKTVLLIFNGAFFASFMTSFQNAVPLLLFIATGYLFVFIIYYVRTKVVLAVFIVLIIAAFVYLRRYTALDFLPSIPFPYVAIGLSYILFRVIHLLVDSYGGVIKDRMTPLAYFNYICFFSSYYWSFYRFICFR